MNARMDDLQAKYEEMAQKMKGKQSVAENLLQTNNLPFIDRVMRFPLPMKFKVLQVEMHDGSKDPVNHIEKYRAVEHT
jgi:uncharacterized protein (DUF1919 family)